MSESVTIHPPRGWLKLFFKIPVLVARCGLAGWERLIGVEWMLLATIGRKSGKKRYTMVDVLQYEKESDTYFIEAGFGKRSDWYRNIQANPIFEAQVGRRKFLATSEELSAECAVDVMLNFIQRRPMYAESVLKMVNIKFTSEEAFRRMASQWVLLAVRPRIK